MYQSPRRLLAGAALSALALVSVLVYLVLTAPAYPTALIRVVDAAGKPIPDAVIQPEGMRTKPGPYSGGWYGWQTGSNAVPARAVRTGKNGYASVPYPKYVFERIETGVLCLGVDHPDFVPARPECVVATAPPSGAPWKVRWDDIWRRLQRQALLTQTDPVTLQRGAILMLSARPEPAAPMSGRLFAQVSGLASSDARLWMEPAPGAIMTRRLGAGPHTLRAVQFDADGFPWFSDVLQIDARVGQTNNRAVILRKGTSVRGELDQTVPRPVRHGRVVATIRPPGINPQEEPPEWHGWASVDATGKFELAGVPPGELEIAAMCDRFVSTNGPGKFQMRYPQQHVLGETNLTIRIGMEPTARLEVRVLDDQGQPLEGARVETWPNIRYGEWSATILMSDCYNTSDWLRATNHRAFSFDRVVPGFHAISDRAGLAVLSNLPVTVRELAVAHPRFVLPAVSGAAGEKHRQATVTLRAGETNRTTVQLEPSLQSPIRHY